MKVQEIESSMNKSVEATKETLILSELQSERFIVRQNQC